MIKAHNLIDFTEIDYLTYWKLFEIYEDILYANNEGQNNINTFISDDIIDNVKLELISNGFVVESTTAKKYNIKW